MSVLNQKISQHEETFLELLLFFWSGRFVILSCIILSSAIFISTHLNSDERYSSVIELSVETISPVLTQEQLQEKFSNLLANKRNFDDFKSEMLPSAISFEEISYSEDFGLLTIRKPTSELLLKLDWPTLSLYTNDELKITELISYIKFTNQKLTKLNYLLAKNKIDILIATASKTPLIQSSDNYLNHFIPAKMFMHEVDDGSHIYALSDPSKPKSTGINIYVALIIHMLAALIISFVLLILRNIFYKLTRTDL